MAFDSYGDLWITTGKNARDYPRSYDEASENMSTEATSANLADFRGGVLRIHPDNSAKGYTVPAGNFGEYWSAQFRAKGNAALADEYANPAKVLPELYVKGNRNAYSISVHPTRRWLAWGEFGVNTQDTYTEEHNLVTRPVFGGYPYFAGGFGTGAGKDYYPLWSGAGSSVYNAAHPGLSQSISGPINNSVWNKGPRQLPPVTPALHTYMHGVRAGAVTGPIYRYDPASKSTVKWPPHFDGAWFITDFTQDNAASGFKGAKIFKLNAAGEAKVDSVQWFQNLEWYRPISFDQGPDGALYVVMYHGWHDATSGTHIGRLEYTGTCRPDASTFLAHPARTQAGAGLRVGPRSLYVTEPGASRLIIRDSRGREIFAAEQVGPKEYTFGGLHNQPAGICLITLESARGSHTVKWIPLLPP